MRHDNWRLIAGGVLALMLLTHGCGPIGAPVTPLSPTASVSFTPIPTFTRVPAALPTVLATTAPIVTSVGAVSANISADNVNLRIEPGTVFPVRLLLAKGTPVKVLGHAPGGEWFYVQTNSGIAGWVLYWLVNAGTDLGPTPLVEPHNVQVVQGHIVDRAGVPVSGIGFAVTQGTGSTALRTDASSDRTGQFYAYLPLTASGQWFVSYASVACTSNTMDARCNCIGKCGAADPPGVNITLPHDGILQFVWR